MLKPLPIDDWLHRIVRQNEEHSIILLDDTGAIVAWLGAAEKIFGYAADEMIGKHFSILFTPEDLTKGMPVWELEVASKDGHAEDDRWMLRKDGRRFWATGILMPIRADDGHILGFGKILRNRTDVKAQLESTQRRTERLQRAIESKNNFIATLAHEFRNPLSSIANAISILKLAGAHDDETQYCRATIERQLDHLQRMIADLLEFAKADAGKIVLQRRDLIINDILRSAVDTCGPLVDRHGHCLELLMPAEAITVHADAARLQQIFVNLIENAAKYTNRGGNIWIKLSVEGSEAVVKFEDTGLGISPELMPGIFDLFTQADASKGSGLGIGLSLVKDLTQLHGGTVQVRSDGIGKGSEFTVRLPLAGRDAQRPDSPDAA